MIYDIEIRRAILGEGEQRLDGIEYAEGWHDHAGMGIACLCGFDLQTQRYRVFLADNLDAFADEVRRGRRLVSFNGHQFDDHVCRAAGIPVEESQSIDLAALIWRAAGIELGTHPKGLGLEAICRINGLGSKCGNGALAPVLWQQGRHGEVIDYCLGDVTLTLALYRRLRWMRGCIDPRTGQWLTVEIPEGAIA